MQSKNKSRLSWLGDLDIIVAAAVLSVLIVLTFMGVIWRYLFKAPFTWLEEVQLACMVWIVLQLPAQPSEPATMLPLK